MTAEPLLLELRQGDPAPADAAPADATDAAPEVELVAFAAHGRLSGRIRLDRSRLTDMLNAHEAFRLGHVLATRLPEGESRVMREVYIRRAELVLVHAGGPRGDQARRTKTVARAITVKCGPYLVTGDVHTAEGIDPLLYFRRRDPMVPLTDAIIVYASSRGLVEEGVELVIVNRDQASWVRRAEVVRAVSSAGLRALARSSRGIELTG